MPHAAPDPLALKRKLVHDVQTLKRTKLRDERDALYIPIRLERLRARGGGSTSNARAIMEGRAEDIPDEALLSFLNNAGIAGRTLEECSARMDEIITPNKELDTKNHFADYVTRWNADTNNNAAVAEALQSLYAMPGEFRASAAAVASGLSSQILDSVYRGEPVSAESACQLLKQFGKKSPQQAIDKLMTKKSPPASEEEPETELPDEKRKVSARKGRTNTRSRSGEENA